MDNVRRRFRRDVAVGRSGRTLVIDATESTFVGIERAPGFLGTDISLRRPIFKFAELEEKITAYSSTHFVQLWKKDARTIEAAKKRVGKIASKMSDALKYHSVKYCCVHGGKKFTTKASTRTSS